MATLASTVIDRVVKKFRTSDQKDVLNGAINNSTTSAVYTGILGDNIGPSSLLEIDSELMMVTAVDADTNTLTVVRGMFGTTKATHDNGAIIYIDPMVHRADVLDLINFCLVDIFPRLYAVATKEITYSGTAIGYDLDAEVLDILRVDAWVSTNASEWIRVYDWEKYDNMPTAQFASGNAIMIRKSLPSASTLLVVYTKPFVKITAEGDDLEADALLKDYMTDLPYYFVMSRLMAKREADRSQVDSAQSHQRAQDVPAFLAMQTGEWFKARYQDLMETCRARLVKETRKVIGTGYGR